MLDNKLIALPTNISIIKDTWVIGNTYYVGKTLEGTDGKIYKCFLKHDAAATNKPITGISYATYWSEITMAQLIDIIDKIILRFNQLLQETRTAGYGM